jgi:hypothetical protein
MFDIEISLSRFSRWVWGSIMAGLQSRHRRE